MKILLAVDGSEYTRKMLEYVAANRTLFNTNQHFVLFHCPPAVPAHARSMVGTATVQGFHEDEAQRVLKPAAEALRASGLAVTSDWRAGAPGETIAGYAREGGFDLILMGAHGHGSLARLVMGSVTNEVLSNCRVPVLLIR